MSADGSSAATSPSEPDGAPASAHAAGPVGIFHIGVMVQDIDEALPRLRKAFGVNFRPVQVATISGHSTRMGDPAVKQLRFSFSREGPPWIEVTEAHGSGVYGLHQGEGVHHIGVWTRRAGDWEKEFVGGGWVRWEARTELGGITRSWMNEPSSLNGIRIEYIDDADREKLEAFLNAPVVSAEGLPQGAEIHTDPGKRTDIRRA